MNVRWIVDLSEEERAPLEELLRGGTVGARVMKRALILLRSDDGWTAQEIAEALGVGICSVYRRRQRYVEEGLPQGLHDEQRRGAKRKLNALQEATLVALACSDAPVGRAKWTMQLLADELVVLTEVDDLSAETVRRRLAEKELKPWQRKMWFAPVTYSDTLLTHVDETLHPQIHAPDLEKTLEWANDHIRFWFSSDYIRPDYFYDYRAKTYSFTDVTALLKIVIECLVPVAAPYTQSLALFQKECAEIIRRLHWDEELGQTHVQLLFTALAEELTKIPCDEALKTPLLQLFESYTNRA